MICCLKFFHVVLRRRSSLRRVMWQGGIGTAWRQTLYRGTNRTLNGNIVRQGHVCRHFTHRGDTPDYYPKLASPQIIILNHLPHRLLS